MIRRRFLALLAVAVLAAGCHRAAPPAVAPAATTGVDWIRHGAIYEVFVRDFSPSGDFRGVTANLDRIEATGANIVWLMPIYPVGVAERKGTLGSPYAVRDYHAVNPLFGTASDFQALVDAVHARGMRIILDWVPNHTAWDNVWTTEHPDYYVRDAKGGLTVPRDDKGNLTDWTDVAQLDYGNPALRRAMITTMQWWLDTYHIDGFRVDAAGFVPDAFWQEAVPALRAATDRPILMLAEWGDLKMHRFGFDLTYSWDAYGQLKAVWEGAPAHEWVERQVADQKAMPVGGMRLRFSTNHDETAWDKPPMRRFGGSAGARAAFAAMVMLPGRPLIYNGQDVESDQQLALFEREAIDWDQPGAQEALGYYRSLVRLARSDYLAAAPLAAVETSAPDDVIAFRREGYFVFINVRHRVVPVTVRGESLLGTVDVLHRGAPVSARFELPPHGVRILEPFRPRALAPR